MIRTVGLLYAGYKGQTDSNHEVIDCGIHRALQEAPLVEDMATGLLPGEPLLSLPAPPDFIVCHPIYSQGLSPSDCLQAANGRFFRGASEVQYVTHPGADPRNPVGGYSLPFDGIHGQ